MSRINLFPEFVSVSDTQLVRDPIFFKSSQICNDDILLTIFAPDPLTGVPRSDLGIVMSKDKSPEVAQYIRDTLMRPISDNSVRADDADFAISSVKDRRESITAYASRLRTLVNSKSDD